MDHQLRVALLLLDNMTAITVNRTIQQIPIGSPDTPPDLGQFYLYAKDGGVFQMDSNGAETFLGESNVPTPPPSGTENTQQYLTGTLGTAGLNSGIINQNVDGSLTPQSFFMESDENYDIYITRLSVIIIDKSVSHNKFGALSALPVGWDLKLVEDGNTTLLAEKAKTCGEAQINTFFAGVFGDSSNINVIPNFNDASEDLYTINFQFDRIIPPYGLRLGRGNTGKIESVINDDLEALSFFKVLVGGYKNVPAL